MCSGCPRRTAPAYGPPCSSRQCPLACRWCHNPESISPRPEVQWFRSPLHRLSFLRRRLPARVHQLRPGRGCGSTDRAAMAAAPAPRPALPRPWRPLAGASASRRSCGSWSKTAHTTSPPDGGVTLSGGEPMAQPAFHRSICFARLKELGIPTAVDTCGFASMDSFARILPDIDLLLYDLKTIDPGHASTPSPARPMRSSFGTSSKSRPCGAPAATGRVSGSARR